LGEKSFGPKRGQAIEIRLKGIKPRKTPPSPGGRKKEVDGLPLQTHAKKVLGMSEGEEKNAKAGAPNKKKKKNAATKVRSVRAGVPEKLVLEKNRS